VYLPAALVPHASAQILRFAQDDKADPVLDLPVPPLICYCFEFALRADRKNVASARKGFEAA